MQFANFTQTNQDRNKPSGTDELGGIPVHAFFDRSNPARAWLTIRHDMGDGAQLLPRLQAVTAVTVAGAQVPVRAVTLKCSAGALQGSLDPALVEAVAGPAALAPPASEAEAATEAAPASDAGAAPGAGTDRLVELSTQLAAAKAERAGHAARVKDLRGEIAALRQQLEIAEAGLSSAGDTASEHAERCAELRQQIRDLLDDEETG